MVARLVFLGFLEVLRPNTRKKVYVAETGWAAKQAFPSQPVETTATLRIRILRQAGRRGDIGPPAQAVVQAAQPKHLKYQ